jgi:predicted DsbA family dithiol-disulfide isomerase
VPTFIINDRYKIVGAYPYQRLWEVFRHIATDR